MQALRKGVVSALAALLSLTWVPAQDTPAPSQQPQAQAGAKDAQNKDDIRTGADGDRANRMTLRLKERDLREVVQIMQRKANANIIMEPGIEAAVTIELQDVHWRQALSLVAEQAGCIVREAVPGGILTVMLTKQWTRAQRTYLEGNVLSTRVDVEALGLPPLALHPLGEWDPKTEYWGEEGDPIEDWAKPIIARGKRPMFEMERVVPGDDPEDFDSDPIVLASELSAAGNRAGAREVLMTLLAQDLRCLDAHAHLGNFAFDRSPAEAQRHYEMGMRIGAFSLGRTFDGALAWGLIDNRPFLRCLHGVGLCAWRLGHTREAAAVFHRMLWLNPTDNQGARFSLAAIEAGKTWEELENDA